MIIRYYGHEPDVMMVDSNGRVYRKFQLNESPNNTGMTVVYWNGTGGVSVSLNCPVCPCLWAIR